MDDQGELVVQLVRNSDGSIEIEAYISPEDKASFSKESLQDVFLMAAVQNNEDIQKDTEAADLLNSYFQGKVAPHKSNMFNCACAQHSEESAVLDNREVPIFNVQCSDWSQTTSETKTKYKKTTLVPGFEHLGARMNNNGYKPVSVLATKKYKPVALKVKPLLGDLPDKFRIVRDIKGDLLVDMPVLNPNPPEFEPTGCYTLERKLRINENHPIGFLWPEERKLVHHFMCLQEQGFAWDDTEAGHFREDFFLPIDIPIVPHTPWVLRNIPIPPGIYDKVCHIIKSKIDSGVYEPSNSSYRSR
ncbi:uncharacterized protein ARMOST_17766 [Armillaria ostoyae]|uniref:Uncharacterized protein n=1 Tax=Armillaria ostoyae TaxID=47428 RepID=A0A284RZY1_ARMOS|nr:uncharacterized protein ARMOST_17766 [Armillaria ostoyae]